MDNVTHTLIGYTLGQLYPAKNPSLRKAAIWTAVIGNNLPDLDFLLRPFGMAGNLGYLLQHRGYTHTVLFSLPLGVLSAWAGMRLAKLKKTAPRYSPEWGLYSLGVASILLHVAADFCNNYGVHPFSPIFNGWFYGDTLMIIEPWIWLALLPLVFFKTRSKPLRGLVVGIELLLLGLVWSLKFTPLPIALTLTFGALVFVEAQRHFRSAVLGLSCVALTLLTFATGSAVARHRLKTNVLDHHPDAVIHQLSLTPMPGNPFCWSAVVSTTEKSQFYVARAGSVSLLPHQFPANQCSLRAHGELSSALTPIEGQPPPSEGVHWIGEFQKPWSEVKNLSQTSCRFNAFLRFARFPIWQTDRSTWTVGDLRYDLEKGGSFSQTSIDPGLPCVEEVPPWNPPGVQL